MTAHIHQSPFTCGMVELGDLYLCEPWTKEGPLARKLWQEHLSRLREVRDQLSQEFYSCDDDEDSEIFENPVGVVIYNTPTDLEESASLLGFRTIHKYYNPRSGNNVSLMALNEERFESEFLAHVEKVKGIVASLSPKPRRTTRKGTSK